jgi:hypothetical protein
MSQDNSNVVAIVGILAIILLVAIAIYFFLIAGNGGGADIEIDLPGASSLETTLDIARGSDTVSVGVHFPA